MKDALTIKRNVVLSGTATSNCKMMMMMIYIYIYIMEVLHGEE